MMLKNGLKRILDGLGGNLAPIVLLLVRFVFLDCGKWSEGRKQALVCVISVVVRLSVIIVLYLLLRGLLTYAVLYFLIYYALLVSVLPLP